MLVKSDPYCKGCDYLSCLGTCDFILLTGVSRPCPYGADCNMHTNGGGILKTCNWDTAQAQRLLSEGRTHTEIAELVGATPAAVTAYFYRNRQRSPVANPAQATPVAPAVAAPTAVAPAPTETVVLSKSTVNATKQEASVAMPLEKLAMLLTGLATLYPHARVFCGGISVGTVSIAITGPEMVDISLGAGGRP